MALIKPPGIIAPARQVDTPWGGFYNSADRPFFHRRTQPDYGELRS